MDVSALYSTALIVWQQTTYNGVINKHINCAIRSEGAKRIPQHMDLQFFGAVRSVTGSQHMVTVNGLNILLDCGLYQGKRSLQYERNLNLPYNASEVDLMILSHAHIDHSGNIPNLVKSGFRGDIFCTHATRDLCNIMLLDSAKIQESDIRYVNKKLARKKQPLREAIYTMEDATQALKYFVGCAYDRARQIAPGIWLTFVDAGHIIGSAMVILDIEDQQTKSTKRLVFSGDIGRPNRPILRDPSFIDEADVLLIESTYGNREHKIDAVSDSELRDVINATVKRGGKVIVPAFAVGRTQELVYRMHRLIHEDEIPYDLPIYVDSPLAINATSVYQTHPEAYDAELEQFLSLDAEHDDAFGFGRLKYTRSVEESKAINMQEGPAVIISASGMAEAGRILHHLKNNVQDPRNTVLIVGWTAPHTLGRRIAEKKSEIKIFGEPYQLNAQVATMNGFSAHADRGELLEWIGSFKKRPKHTYCVHGDEQVSLEFAEELRRQGFDDVNVPHLLQKYSV